MAKKTVNINVKLEGRLAFPNLWEPKSVNGEGEPRHSATLLIPPGSESHKKMWNTMLQAAAEMWPDEDPKSIVKELYDAGRTCLRHGDKSYEGKPPKAKKYDGFAGMLYVTASNKRRPGVFDRDRSPLTANDGRPYGGCYVIESIDVWAQDNQYGRRLNATLVGVQFVKDGDSFGGGRVAREDEFEPLADTGDDLPFEPDAAELV